MGKIKPPRIALDTCVILDYFQKTPKKYEFIKPLFDDAEAGNLIICLSAFCISEITYIKLPGETKRRKWTDAQKEALDEFFSRDYIEHLGADFLVCECAQRIQNDKRFDVGMIDAIHVASAVMNKVPMLLTFDGRRATNLTPLLKLNFMLHLMMAPMHPTLEIITPEDYWNKNPTKTMFFGNPAI